MNIRKPMLALALLAAILPLRAEESQIDYGFGSGDTTHWGLNSCEPYNCGIRLADPLVVGSKITGFTIPVEYEEGIENYKVWITRSLEVSVVDGKKTFVPDVLEAEVTPADGLIVYTLDEPVTIGEEGIHVGYSFNVPSIEGDNTRRPVVVYPGTDPDGFLFYNRLSYSKWTDLSTKNGVVLAIQVHLQGEFPVDDVLPISLERLAGGKEKPLEMEVLLRNNATNPVRSIEYTYSYGSVTETLTREFDPPVCQFYNTTASVLLPLNPVEVPGEYALTLSIGKVNGVDNPSAAAKVGAEMVIYPFLPVHRPFFEEFTGTWCSYCPRGYVGMELMRERHPDTFMGVAYHDGDPMQADCGAPTFKSGDPYGSLERRAKCDPYMGYTSDPLHFSMEEAWLEARDTFAPVEVELESNWNAYNDVDVTTTLTWAQIPDEAEYRLYYLLIHDGMKGEGQSWEQKNGFVNRAQGEPEYMDLFSQSSSTYIPGLEFNDVVILTSPQKGVVNSIDYTAIEPLQPMQHTYHFNLANALGTNKKTLIQDRSKLRVMAVVLKMDSEWGTALNANRIDLGADPYEGSRVEELQTLGAEAAAECYDLSGIRIAEPDHGIYVRVSIDQSGVRRAEKIRK